MIDSRYKAQVDLLLQTIPHVAKEKIFALKGGTAINLFVRDMPRLSVDIDLTYIPLDDRETALRNISNGLVRIKGNLEKIIPNISVTPTSREGQDVKINCQLPGAQIKIEVNTITRGIIQPTRLMKVRESVENEFGKFAAISVVSHAELYGGKICAALDRQHPRDIFDVRLLLDNEGFTDEVKNGLLVALISHMRPLNEVISPEFIDQRQAFETQFSGMTSHTFSYNDYEETRKQLVGELHSKLTEKDKMFLLSFKNGKPDWELFPFEIAEQLPAVLWKLQNIIKLRHENPGKHQLLLHALKEVLIN
jgi:predicted nucleotidyltransferase component of viral defense system